MFIWSEHWFFECLHKLGPNSYYRSKKCMKIENKMNFPLQNMFCYYLLLVLKNFRQIRPWFGRTIPFRPTNVLWHLRIRLFSYRINHLRFNLSRNKISNKIKRAVMIFVTLDDKWRYFEKQIDGHMFNLPNIKKFGNKNVLQHFESVDSQWLFTYDDLYRQSTQLSRHLRCFLRKLPDRCTNVAVLLPTHCPALLPTIVG